MVNVSQSPLGMPDGDRLPERRRIHDHGAGHLLHHYILFFIDCSTIITARLRGCVNCVDSVSGQYAQRCSGAGLMAQIRHDHRISVAQRFQHVERQNGQREAQPTQPDTRIFRPRVGCSSKLLILRCSVILHRIRRNRSSKLKRDLTYCFY